MNILCVGRNYARHVREMGSAPPTAPIWFWKPESALVGDGDAIGLPRGVGAVHHEVELAVRIGKPARRVPAPQALAHVEAITVANDVTARDLQEAAKKAGTPWAQAKGHDTFLPLGVWVPRGGRDLQDLGLRLSVGGKVRQQGSTRDMTWTVAELLSLASQWTTLNSGDVLLTGTPEGVGPLAAGDVVECEVVGVARLRNPVQWAD
ncbi:MAG: fumarylacetoacetate hydrolase family protein [Thermoplasmatota archaeon]|nr:fumarylacetoacetate hydrolase family protein [Halobacteriales archaeon]